MNTNLRTFGGAAVRGWFSALFLPRLVRFLPVRTLLVSGLLLAALSGTASVARAQGLNSADDASYRKELVYGLNFNTRAGLIGGVVFRSSKVLSRDWLRFWSIEGVEVKHPKEVKDVTLYGGTLTREKSNYFFVLRPSVGAQRVLFRKAAESGVQVNALGSAGPSIGLLMPYYVYYDYTVRDANGRPVNGTSEDYRAEQYNPDNQRQVVDRAPLFSGISGTKPTVGVHLRGALSFEYGRYRDAVAGVETGFLFEYFPSRPTILSSYQATNAELNNTFYPSVYLTIYIGHRN